MRFKQLIKESGTVVRKKMYKSGKLWIVASILSFVGGASMFLMTPLNTYASSITDEPENSVPQTDNDASTGYNSLEKVNVKGSNIPNNVNYLKPNTDPVTQKEINQPIESNSNNIGGNTVSEETPSGNEAISSTSPTTFGNTGDTNDETAEIPNADKTNDDIPAQIQAEGIFQQGTDGTAPYYITNKKTVYFLDGELSKDDTEKVLGEGDFDFQRAHVDKIDTSLAKDKVYTPEDSTDLFSNIGVVYDGSPDKPARVEHLTTVDFSKLDTSRTTNMSNMFLNSYFEELNLNSFDTSHVTNMSNMFEGLNLYMADPCNLNISNFDISNVSDKRSDAELDGFYSMFSGTNVKELNLTSFKKAKVTSLESMFMGVKTDKIIMPNFDTSNIKEDWNYLFEYAEIGHLDISKWDMKGNNSNYGATLFGDAKIGSITLGPKNKFNWFEALNSSNGSWINVGRGTIDDPEGNLTFSNRKVGDYVDDNKSVKKYYDGTGKTGVDTFIPYVDVIHGDLSVPTTVDNKSSNNIEFKDLFGQPGKDIKLRIPNLKGYHTAEDFITAIINPNGTITTSDTIAYLKDKTNSNNGQHHGSSGNSLNKISTHDSEQFVSTLINNGKVNLYNLDGNTFNLNNDRALAAGTDWYSDKYVTTKDMVYYRVSTNEWVKAASVYTYSPQTIIFDNKDDVTYLVDSKNQLVKSRALNPRSSWLVDRIGYLGDYRNPVRTYRVATNEFVKI